MRVTTHTIRDAEKHQAWGGPGEDFHGSDLIDAQTHPRARMTVGFARVAAGQRMRAAFPYDEVMVVTKGSVRISTEEGRTHTVHAGEFVYAPAESTNTYVFDEDFEAVYVASPPSVYAQHVARTSGQGRLEDDAR